MKTHVAAADELLSSLFLERGRNSLFRKSFYCHIPLSAFFSKESGDRKRETERASGEVGGRGRGEKKAHKMRIPHSEISEMRIAEGRYGEGAVSLRRYAPEITITIT